MSSKWAPRSFVEGERGMREPVLFKQPDKLTDCLKLLLPNTMTWVLVVFSLRKWVVVHLEIEERQEGTSKKRVDSFEKAGNTRRPRLSSA